MTSSPAKIRLVHCIGTMNVGGSERQLVEIIERLPRERFEQSLVLLYEGGPLLERVERAGCEVEILGYRPAGPKWSPRFWAEAARALRRYRAFLGRRRPDIVHGKLYWANILSALAGRAAGVPIVVTSRLQMSEYEMGGRWPQGIENLANRWTDVVLVNSEGMRADVLAHERIDPAKIHRIYNGVDPAKFRRPPSEEIARLRGELGLDGTELVLATVANLHPHKGHEDLLRAAANLRTRLPGLRLLMAGRDQGMRARLEALIAELGLGREARLLGERRDVAAILAVADFVVHPSRAEGFSNAILEAMASGRAVVATDVGGNAEAVVDGRCGLIVPPGDVSGLGRAIETLAADPDLLRRMGEAGRARAESEFSIEVTVPLFARWYEELAARGGRKRNPAARGSET